MEPIILPRISDKKPLVSVVSITYNHEPYIRDCLEGFLMQKTDFPVEVIIHDDASTDHTADILREYYEMRPDLFHIIIERENQYSQHKLISHSLIEMAQGKYIALCDGDDFWIDSQKLQIQFDFMENNPGYSFCGSNGALLDETKKTLTDATPNTFFKNEASKEEIQKKILERNIWIRTASYFFVKNIFLKIQKDLARDQKTTKCLDFPLLFHLAGKGKIKYFPKAMVVYRMHDGSFSSYENILKAAHLYFIAGHQYGLMAAHNGYKHIRNSLYQTYYNKIYRFLIVKGFWKRARKFAITHNFNPSTLFFLVVFLQSRIMNFLVLTRRRFKGSRRYKQYKKQLYNQ